MKIAVLMGGSSAERDASLENGKRIIAALEEAEHTPVAIDVSEDLVATLRAERPDAFIVSVACKMGEDGTLQGLLDFLGIPYAGSCSEVCRSVADKSLLSAHMQAACDFSGEQTVASWPQGFCFSKVVFDELGAFGAGDLFEDRIPGGYPLAVKPACEGLAYGVHKANNKEELRDALRDAFTFDDKVIVQQWIEGVELAVSVIGTGWDAHALPPVEIVPKRGLYDTAARMDASLVDYYAPVRNESLSSNEADAQAIRAEIERAVLEVYRAYGLRDLGRIDLIWDGAQARVMETNVSPGMTETSLFPAACKAGGLSLSAVLNELVSNAKERGAVFC